MIDLIGAMATALVLTALLLRLTPRACRLAPRVRRVRTSPRSRPRHGVHAPPVAVRDVGTR